MARPRRAFVAVQFTHERLHEHQRRPAVQLERNDGAALKAGELRKGTGAGGPVASASPAITRGCRRGGSKLHLVRDGAGIPLAVEDSAGQRHEGELAAPLLQAARVPSRAGLYRPGALAADKGYRVRHLRRWLRRQHARW